MNNKYTGLNFWRTVLRQIALVIIPLVFSPSLWAQNWQLVWSDEFTNSIGPDWVFEIGTGGGGWGNNELQYYRQENATIENGFLVITARQQSFNGSAYTSARMKTQGRKSFKYGKIEARIAAPSGSGLWPAFWTLGNSINSVGWPQCGEIDIMEHVNSAPEIHGTMHWQDHNNSYANYGGSVNTNIGNFHVYSIEWDASAIKWFIDGNQYHEASIADGVNGTSEFHEEFFILLNLAVGGNWPGFVIDNGALPARMMVDYVRVYADPDVTDVPGDNGNPGGGVDLQLVTEAENYSAMNGVQTEATSDTGGGINVGWIDNGDWLAYSGITVPASGNYLVEYRVASVNGGQLSLDLNAGSIVLGSITVPATGGWQNWTTISQTVYLEQGQYDFGIYAITGGWNLNWWKLSSL